MNGVLRISYADEHEKERKLCAIVRALGYRVEPGLPERITVGELARRVGRKAGTVSMSLRRPHCPPFESKRGKKQIIWLEPNPELLAFLSEDRKGQRTP